ncbi:hypothetical protein ACHAXS_001487 [Conticribra weissflogii]
MELHSLKKAIIHKQYPLPFITDMLDHISQYKFFTKLDISMQYYTFELNEPSQELCVIVTPFGKYKYNHKHLSMVLKCTPDFAQQVMEEVLCNVNNTGIYLNNDGAFSSLGNTTSYSLTKYYIGWKPIASLSTCLTAKEPSRTLIGLDTGFCTQVKLWHKK